MDFDAVLADLKEQFPGAFVLYIDDIAAVLARSPKAVRMMVERGTLPEVGDFGGRVGIGVRDMAAFLCGGNRKSKRAAEPKGKAAAAQRKPRVVRAGRLPDLSATIAAARRQGEFALALANALEALSLRDKVADKAVSPRPPRNPP